MKKIKTKGKKILVSGGIFIVAFIIWTMLIKLIDVQNTGVNESEIGFSAFNNWFHSLTGVNMMLYNITDWLGLVPLFCCMVFAVVGSVQLIKRKSLLKVDSDIIFLGVYYVIVILLYLFFEMIPINYRPVLIDGLMEVSYPSSTTLLVLAVMPTVVFQADKRLKNNKAKKIIKVIAVLFSVFVVSGRLVCGVHWFTDIIGSVLISAGLFCIYKAVVLLTHKE